ncbi:dTDP-4-dehydrorhamnose reductase family protein [Alkalispirochaeta alkalica]|uniref:dTDP-4-dehydrorhamnose reductase family protein n=1 Tax=Alkalispirochaeta alkalica TaxID=46356 RepID=UPI000477E0B9|nr:SDR family oxidoreductase [Alkalispirochaeta alkalica]
MRVLILGATGMAGHVIQNYLSASSKYEVVPASRSGSSHSFEASDLPSVERLLRATRPDFVVNCVGVLVQAANTDPALAVNVNSLLPHALVRYGREFGFRLIHISTDCVFSGQHGPYVESDPTDAWDYYGKSKALGEVIDDKNVTIRTSIIGPEIRDDKTGLLEWFLAQNGVVQGYTRAVWSGVTTLELAKFVDQLLQKPELTGLVHLTNGKGISKFDLLCLIQEIWSKGDVQIEPYCEKRVNKSLVSSRRDLGYVVPGYHDMLAELKEMGISRAIKHQSK